MRKPVLASEEILDARKRHAEHEARKNGHSVNEWSLNEETGMYTANCSNKGCGHPTGHGWV
ncbi:MAG: hypothetical protein ACYCZW_03745 [Minisyncoccota bacterium]